MSILVILLFGFALTLLYRAYVLAAIRVPPALSETIQASRVWLPIGLLLLFIHYSALLLSSHGAGLEPLAWTAGLVTTGLVADFAIYSFYRPRILNDWPEGEWFRDTLRGLVYLGLARLAYSHLSVSHPLQFGTSSAFLSVALGFILRPTLGNVISGLVLRIAQPYSLGDFVQIGQRLGVVYSIDWRSTSLSLISGDLNILPSSYISRQPIYNFSQPSRSHACSIELRLPAHIPPDRIREVMLEAIRPSKMVHPSPEPEVFLAGFEGGNCRYRLQFWIGNMLERFQAESEVQSLILYRLLRENIPVANTTTTFVQLDGSSSAPAID